MITKYLNKKNIDAMYTNNAKNGLELIKKNNFDCVILIDDDHIYHPKTFSYTNKICLNKVLLHQYKAVY